MSRPLRRTRGDLIATGVISAVCVAAVAGVWLTAPIRDSELTPAAAEYSSTAELSAVPESLSQEWTRSDEQLPGVFHPVTVNGVIASVEGQTVTAVDQSGETLWSYTRNLDLCSMAGAWGKIVITYRSAAGCGDVVSIDAGTGQYDATRSSIAPLEVVPVVSNDRIGTAGRQRLELWRSDLVRTVEYGEVEGIQEPGLQPHQDCDIESALTRTELLAVTESCPDNPGTWLRLQETSPEDARKPEINQDIYLPTGGSRLVAIAQEAVTVFVPGLQPELISYSDSGQELSRTPVESAALIDAAVDSEQSPFAPVTADLPHHMSWFDGERLYLFSPTELSPIRIYEDVVGTAVAVGDDLLVPTVEGIAVTNPDTGVVERIIPVDRAGYEGMVTLAIAGETIVEKRGDELFGLV
ncbi:hypothetical protein [Corynebacterium alimapuense]|uniref:Uncharacterized protein n=1 Tax=Corynebacterium alimapuense TaxID=1576874 RepID=A0A3M8K7K2_9CORY|nr:hypothetical protein [Corynebacterium alimapuense]RNE48735.1 hypothetical protein C5L39_05335 [Corynebacterium alimapuense]